MKYVVGIDLGTSAVKIILVNNLGEVVQIVTKSLKLIQKKSGYSEQNPEDWVIQTIKGLSELMENFTGDTESIEGISFSGQMHGLVLLDKNNEVLRDAILWNDTRTSAECEEIHTIVGKEKLLKITQNIALDGFTLPKLLWVKKHEPNVYKRTRAFLLPKDYLRYRLTGKLQMELSDAAGTLLLNVEKKKWSQILCELLDIDDAICPPLVNSTEYVGKLLTNVTLTTGLSPETKVFAGGADNACGAIGAGIIEEGKTLCSIGTSGVVLAYETSKKGMNNGKVHFFNHSVPDAFYSMGVTLSAGHSLEWFKETFAPNQSFEELLKDIDTVSLGANGLLFTPYIVGERTPHASSSIRGSFVGVDSNHKRKHFVRAVLEGITFSLNESIQVFKKRGKKIEQVVSIGGGAKSESWLQMQADIFNAPVIKLSSEQGPGIGAAMIAAVANNWFSNFKDCSAVFVKEEKRYIPIEDNVEKYNQLFLLYQQIYPNSKQLHKQLREFRI